MIAELVETNYTFKGDALLLEPKDVIKVKLGRSPDLADSFVLSFADTVAPRLAPSILPQRRADTTDYDPFRRYFGARA